MLWLNRAPIVPVLRFSGPIGMATPLRPGLSLPAVAGALEKAFSLSKLPAVAVAINSPGGSPVQSNLIFSRLRQLAAEKEKRIYVFCEDVAASGGYFLAVAGDEIYADPSSIIGSIGVISASFGLDKLIARYGIERRVYTAGKDKGTLDPFRPERPEDVAHLKALQRDVHETFIGIVKSRRAGKLKGPEDDLFSGNFWSAQKAQAYGLIDGVSDMRSKMQELYGPKVRLRAVPLSPGGFLSRFRRLPGIDIAATGSGFGLSAALPDDVISAIEARALWSRFGL
ncbi:MAG: S49 family peptidase [Hyphomicrobiaceae bacterium]|nr:S49 family peptidase [Hyphomicrobiaceae bacterium]